MAGPVGGGGTNTPLLASILNNRETFQQDIERLSKQQYMQVHDVLQFLELNFIRRN